MIGSVIVFTIGMILGYVGTAVAVALWLGDDDL